LAEALERSPAGGEDASQGEVVPDQALDGTLVDDGNQGFGAFIGTTVSASYHSGPLPHPQILADYDDILPGAAERILRMTEKSLDSRIKIQEAESQDRTELVKMGTTLARRAQLFTFVLVLAFIAVTVVAVLKGQEITGAAAGLAAIGTIGWALRGGRKDKQSDEPAKEPGQAEAS
jgi:uncharacterized membrane protein